MFNIVLIVNIELEQTSVQSLDWKIQNAMHYIHIFIELSRRPGSASLWSRGIKAQTKVLRHRLKD